MHSFIHFFFTTCWSSDCRVKTHSMIICSLHIFFVCVCVWCCCFHRRPSVEFDDQSSFDIIFNGGLYVPFFHCDKMLTVIWLVLTAFFFLLCLMHVWLISTQFTSENILSLNVIWFLFFTQFYGLFSLLFVLLFFTIDNYNHFCCWL